MRKALFVDIVISIPEPYLKRIKKHFKNIVTIASGAKDFPKELADSEAILCNISTKIALVAVPPGGESRAPSAPYLRAFKRVYR